VLWGLPCLTALTEDFVADPLFLLLFVPTFSAIPGSFHADLIFDPGTSRQG
jgi:hypothetical protein